MKLIFFPDSHLAPKFFKVVASSKKVGRHFFTLSASYIDSPKLSSTKFYKVDTRMDDIQIPPQLYPRWRLVIDQGACAAFWKQT